MENKDEEAICCPRFNPEPWDEKVFEWENKKFIRDRVKTFFYMPLNFGGAMKRLDRRLKEAEAVIPDYLCLSEHTSKWNMELYLAVDKEIKGAENSTMSGKYYSKVYEGDFKDTGKWCEDFEKSITSKGYKQILMYMWYTTCPKCAKKFGKNYVVLLGEI